MATLLGCACFRYTSHEGDGVQCSRCAAQAAVRSHRRHAYEFLRTRLTGKVPFRCRHCHRRFWLRIDPRDI